MKGDCKNLCADDDTCSNAQSKEHSDKGPRREGEVRILAELLEDSQQPFGIGHLDGRIGHVNRAFERLTGYSREELQAMDWTWALTPPEWQKTEQAKLAELCRTGEPVKYEKEYCRKDGSRVPVELLAHLKKDDTGKPLYYYSFITDITDRKRADERIRHLSYFPQFNPNPIIETDYLGTVTFCNPATQKILESIGAGGDAGLFVPADLDDILRNWDRRSEATHFREVSIGTRAFRETIFLTPQFTVVRFYIHDITDIRQAEKALRENEERLRLFIEHAPAELAMFDRDMRYLSASRRWLSDYGLGDRDLRGECHYEVFPEIPEEWKEAHRRGLAGEELRAEGDRFERVDGSVQWIRWEIHPWYDSSDQVGGIVIFSEDITETKKAEERILQLNRELEQRVAESQLILDTSPIGLAITNDPEGAIIRGNPALEKLLGVPGGGELSKNAFNSARYRVLKDGKELPPSELPMQQAVRGEPVVGETLDIVREDGTRLNLYCSAATVRDKEGRPCGAVGAFMDITERKELENVVMKSQLDVYAILDNIPYRAWLKDTEGRYVKANWPFATACGCASPKEVIGKTDLDLWPAHMAEAFRADDQEVMESGQRKLVEEHIVENGGERWFETFKAPRFDQNGTVIGTTGISRDITERKRAAVALQAAHDDLERKVAERTWELATTLNDLRKESSDRIQALETLREQEQLLIHQGRLAAMGEMIGNIAHQWRQPLNTLGLIIQGLSMSEESGELTKEHLDERVNRAMQLIFHMSQTIDDFRNFFRPDKEKVRFEVKPVINNALSLIGENLQSLGIQVSFDCSRDLSINGYPNEFSQALLNILMNARDVLEERKVDGPRVMVRMIAESNRVVVTIADNAGGIDKEILGKVFDPYFTSKGPSKGTGLGLFIAKTIIEKNMDGTLTVRNTGEGAEFRIVI
ncbi:PAS domain S-box protein [Geobacter sp.]|uniref:PAS domain S-box protein n=1 Tax=Geobacter sp. TaxID=46610 RepID=UPI0027BB1567|nr:PAS domain S-box protein [Geobacter sp.]